MNRNIALYIVTICLIVLSKTSHSQDVSKVLDYLSDYTKSDSKGLVSFLQHPPTKSSNGFSRNDEEIESECSVKLFYEIESFFKDKANFYDDDLYSSCSFIPEVILIFEKKSKKTLYFLLSSDCEELIFSIGDVENVAAKCYLRKQGLQNIKRKISMYFCD